MRFLAKLLMCLLQVFLLILTQSAEAYIYDDFENGVIDSAKWTIASGGTLFAEHDGRLYFDATKDAGKLVSASTFGPGFFRMEFYDFNSTNLMAPGTHEGAFAALGLAVGDNFVRIIRCQNGDASTGTKYGVFEVNYMIGSDIQVHFVNTNVTQGQLGMYYDGSTVTFFYNTTLDPYSGWQSTGWSGGWSGVWNPGWTTDPKVFIRGYDMSYRTRFSLDNVEYRPVPIPAAVWLLGSGLISLIGMRRFRK
jgi:hypothetical protein